MVYKVLEGLLINKILRDVNDLDESIMPERGTKCLHELSSEVIPLKHYLPEPPPVLYLVLHVLVVFRTHLLELSILVGGRRPLDLE